MFLRCEVTGEKEHQVKLVAPIKCQIQLEKIPRSVHGLNKFHPLFHLNGMSSGFLGSPPILILHSKVKRGIVRAARLAKEHNTMKWRSFEPRLLHFSFPSGAHGSFILWLQ